MALAAIAAALSSTTPATAVQRIAVGCGQSRAPKLCSIHQHWRLSNALRGRLGQSAIAYHWRAERHPLHRDLILTYWTQVHRRTLRRWQAMLTAPWLHGSWYASAMCVHAGEGAWTSETGNGYHGGLQFDDSFQQTYGAEWVAAYGDAGHWPPADQLHAAYRAWLSRGWSPWPNTAAACGLL